MKKIFIVLFGLFVVTQASAMIQPTEEQVGWIMHNKREKRSTNEVVKNQAHNKMEEIINKVKTNPALNRPYCYTCSEARIKPGANSCPDDKPLYSVETGCVSCEEYDKIWQNFSDIVGCEKCSNIKEEKCKYKKPPYISVNGQLVNLYSERVQSPETTKALYQYYEQKQSECPSDRPLYAYIPQKCYSCDEIESVSVGIQELSVYCDKICSNREIKNRKSIVMGTNGTSAVCILKDAPSDEFTYNDYFGWIKKCSDDKPLYINNECVACDYYDGLVNKKISDNIPGCDKCPNIPNERCVYKYLIDDTSKKITEQEPQKTICPDDKPILKVDGSCLACDKIDRWTVVQSGCEKCGLKTDGHFCRK